MDMGTDVCHPHGARYQEQRQYAANMHLSVFRISMRGNSLPDSKRHSKTTYRATPPVQHATGHVSCADSGQHSQQGLQFFLFTRCKHHGADYILRTTCQKQGTHTDIVAMVAY